MLMPLDVGLLQGADVVGSDVDEGVGLEFFGVEAGESRVGPCAIDEGGVGGEEGVAAEFVIVDSAAAGECTGFSSEGCGEVSAIVVEIGECDAGEAAHRFVAEVGAAVAISWGNPYR